MRANNMDHKHAIVVGGSMAGLLAARVLSDHYQQVSVVERDTLPAQPQHRRGVPQSCHTHGLLASGSRVLESLFPGISDALVEAGALTSDVVRDCRWFFEGACLARVPSDLKGLLMTRPMLEAAVRVRVLSNPKVRTCDNSAVEGLILDDDGARVIGVRIAGQTLAGDLIVDATGRGSRTPQWLQSLGYEKPREETVQVGIGYATRFFRRRPADLAGDLAAVIPPTPAGKRGGVMLAQEGDRWTVTLIAHFGNYPREDLAGFIEFARSLPAPYIHEVVSSAEPLGDAASTRFPASIRQRYEALKRFPSGYLVFGDAICSFNPIYGQGMSVAALQAVELEKSLTASGDDLAKIFFRRARKVVDIPWSIAVGSDLRIPETVGPRTMYVRIINWYMSRLHQAAHADAIASLAFHQVGNLLAPPPSVMHPRVAVRVLSRNLRLAADAGRSRSRSGKSGDQGPSRSRENGWNPELRR
jgi:2-polyprenyl-6-methoxyphenol hydroxylase-like FAD-dependent oxidoreductase